MTSQAEAQKILGNRMVSLKEVKAIFCLTPIQCRDLDSVPFSRETLCEAPESFRLVLDVGASIADIQAFCKTWPDARIIMRPMLWPQDYSFYYERASPGWRLISTKPVQGSLNQGRDDQLRLVQKGRVVPLARALVLLNMVMMLFRPGDEPVFKGVSVRTGDSELRGGQYVMAGRRMGDFAVDTCYPHPNQYIGLGEELIPE